ncbi:MAG: tetratricopeptide repeat protein [Gammaproteobacteria bacterium]|nr:tetratricopeptide repeat protein [Gammaproteobacteria bacterium]
MDSEDADALRLQILLRQKDWRGATNLAGDMADKRNNPGFDAYVLALTLQAQGHCREGIEQFSRALEKDPRLQGAALGILRCHAALGESKAGLEWLRSYAAAGPENPDRQLMLANELARIGQVKEAGSGLRGSDCRAPAKPRCLQIAWGTRCTAKRILRRRADIRARTGSDPAVAGPRAVAGRYGAASRGSAARGAAVQGSSRADADAGPGGQQSRGPACRGRFRQAEAGRSAHHRAAFRKIGSALFCDTLGWIYYLAGEQENAERLLARAVAGAPEQALFHYHLGAVLEQLGRVPEAREHLQRARTLAAEHGQFDGYDEAMALLARVSRDVTP